MIASSPEISYQQAKACSSLRGGPIRSAVRAISSRSPPARCFCLRLRFSSKVLLVIVLGSISAWCPTIAGAGGACLLHPEGFRLQSDAVHWSMKINSGAECIQGLRWSTIMIDNIFVSDPPKLGRLSLQGPSFRYFSSPGARGSDSFKLSIVGTSLRQKGVSSIEVDVTVQ